MARRGLILAAIAALALAGAPGAQAGQFASEGFGLAGTPGGNLLSHSNSFFRDGLASQCNDGMGLGGSPTGASNVAYKSRAFTSVLNEPVCVTMDVTAPTCAAPGPNEVMSETYSPSYDPQSITANWIGDLGNSPPTQASYSVVVAAGARFETVVDEVSPSANCGGVDVTWSSDRPWAAARPFPSGLPAVGQTLASTFDVWPGDPVVSRQWTRCDATGANCTDIPGATGQSYVVGDDDVGHTIGVDESATEGGLTSTVDGRATRTPVFIPALTIEGQGLVAGDAAVTGRLSVAAPPSGCATPKPVPATTGNDVHFYDAFGLTSLINEPACVWVAQIPRASGGICTATLTVYSPRLNPADLSGSYVADDTRSGILSYALAPGASSEAAIFDDGMFHGCTAYELMFGSDAPFATARPELAGGATEGVAMTTTPGAWGSAPAFTYAWLRCDAGGGSCAPIDGASGATYTPVAGDVGSTLRSRVTATQAGRSASADSVQSALVAAAPSGDKTGPKLTLKLARTTLRKVVRKGFIPVRVTCDEASAITLRARVTRKLGKRLGGVKIASGKGTCRVGRTTKAKAKLTRKARKRLRRRKSVAFKLRGTAVDAAGNSGVTTRKAKLKRTRKR